MKKLYKIFGYVILIIGAVSMLSLSFMTDKQIFSGTLTFIPNPVVNDNYKYVIKTADIIKYFINSMFVAFATTVGQVIISALAGYGFARFKFKFKEPLFMLILVSMMIPPQVNIVPLFYIMKEFKS